MPIRSRYNQYRGVNAHLHSILQSEGGWESFHAEHIGILRQAINRLLPAGYFVLSEKSLQLRQIDLTTGDINRTRPVPDVSIYEQSVSHQPIRGQAVSATPTQVMPLTQTLPSEEYLNSIVISKVSHHRDLAPVTRIELLSPANKPPGAHASTYALKRAETLAAGINLVELDYLHERRSPVSGIPSYPARRKGAFPYLILLNIPLPSLQEERIEIYGFRVDDAIPTIPVPLADDDVIYLQPGFAYNETFTENNYYGESLVDYAELPANFDKYDAEDKKRIKHRMAAIKAAVDAGDALTEIPVTLLEDKN